MARRQVDFIQAIETSGVPTPGTPSASYDIISKGFADSTYAKRSSWYDKQTNITAVKAIASADRSTGQVVFVSDIRTFYSFDAASGLTGDDNLVLTPTSGTGRWLKFETGAGGASGDSLIETFDTKVSTLLAAEAITNRQAVCMEIHNGSGSDEYKIFKTDNDLPLRRGFCGIARETVAVTQGSYTYTISAAYVSGNVVPIVINGRTYSTTYASSSDATLQALATLIAADQDVYSATVTVVGGDQTGTDDRVITILTSNGINAITGAVKLNITGTTVTGGASQPTVTIANPTVAVQTAIDIHFKGPIDSMSGLTPGAEYYLSSTAGALTTTPSNGDDIFVGKALSSTVLFVSTDRDEVSRWGSSEIFVRASGSSSTAASTATGSVEHWNTASWSNGVSSSNLRYRFQGGDASYQSFHHNVGARDTSDTSTATHERYNKSTWGSLTNYTSVLINSSITKFNNFLYIICGNSGAATNVRTKWNASTWTTITASAATDQGFGIFVQNSLLRYMANNSNSNHYTNNTSDSESTSTASPVSGPTAVSTMLSGDRGFFQPTVTTNAYVWSGSWSSAITMSYNASQDGLPATACGYNSTWGMAINNTGSDAGSNPRNNTNHFNGTTATAATASSLSRRGAQGSVI